MMNSELELEASPNPSEGGEENIKNKRIIFFGNINNWPMVFQA